MRVPTYKYFGILLTLLVLLGVVGCSNSSVEADLVDIENQLATFSVVNNSGEVIENITFEISYYSGSEVLKVDTVHYKTSDQPYAKPGESTHFAQQTPATTDNARVRVLHYND